MSDSGSELSDVVDIDLYEAARTGNLDQVTQLLKCGANVNVTDLTEHQTPLHAASMTCYENHHEVLKLLLQHGAEVDALDYSGSGPLHIASRAKNYIAVKYLLIHGADVNKGNFTGHTPLFEACMVGSKRVVKLLLFHGAVVALQDDIGQSPLHIASSYGHTGVIRLLLEYGANVNSLSYSGLTPLHMACYQCRGSLEVFDVLVDSGADVDATDRNGSTPLHLAVEKYYSTGYQFYRKLLQRGAAVDIRNFDNETPYDFCCKDMDEENDQVIKAELVKHVIKLKSAGLFVDIDISAELDFFEETQVECFEELEKIKSIKINDGFSLSTVFSNHKNPWYLKNQSLVQGLEEIIYLPDLEERLPMYTHILRNTFEKTKKRCMLLLRAYNSLNNEYGREWYRNLPDLVKIKVLNYLTNDDLLNLIKSEDEC